MAASRRFSTLETAHVEVYGRMGTLVARMKNLSSTGAFLELANGEYIPQDGDFLHVTINLSTVGRSHAFDAEVVWNKGLGFGVNFIKKDQLLDKMLQRNTF
ncbi:MAG: PilZ domain-containing protein [Bdellovibrionota bacterium]